MKFAIFSSMLLIILMPCSSLLGMVIPSGFATSIVAPTTITQPGTYRLSFDIAGPIVIATDNVVIDLNNNSINATTPISANGRDDIQIFNGTIENATTGIDLTSCSNVKLSDINFNNNATAVSIMTSTGVFVDEASFQGHSGTVITVQDSADSFVRHCAFSNNDTTVISVDNSTSCFFENLAIVDNASAGSVVIIDISNSRSCIFKHIEVNNNSAASGFTGLSFTNCNAMTCKKCIVSNNDGGSSTFNGFTIASGCNNIVCQSSEVNSNSSNDLIGFSIADSSDVILDGGTINQNATTGINIICISSTDSLKVIIQNITMHNNSSAASFLAVGIVGDTDDCLVSNSIQQNTAGGGAVEVGIDIVPTSIRCLVFKNIVKDFNNAGSVAIRPLGTNCPAFSNIAQNNTANYTGVAAGVISTYTPGTGMFSGGSTRKLDNIEA